MIKNVVKLLSIICIFQLHAKCLADSGDIWGSYYENGECRGDDGSVLIYSYCFHDCSDADFCYFSVKNNRIPELYDSGKPTRHITCEGSLHDLQVHEKSATLLTYSENNPTENPVKRVFRDCKKTY